jgi:membrane-bound serine protease (ClpP class)
MAEDVSPAPLKPFCVSLHVSHTGKLTQNGMGRGTPNLPGVRRMILFGLGALFALTACAEPAGGGIDVIDVSGPLDRSALEFVFDSIEQAADVGQELVVVQLNSRAVLDRDAFDRLAALVELPPLPVAVWVGPSPAYAFGAAAELSALASQAAIAPPDSVIGHSSPAVLGADAARSDEELSAGDSGLDLQPTIRQYLQDLDGATFETAAGPVTVSTLQEFGDGVTVKTTTLRKPGLVTRFFRLAVTPEAAFFFLAIGLTIAVFEFYALGPGVAAGVAVISLLLGGWGLLTLPTNWWAVALMLLAFLILVTSYQRGGIMALTAIGAIVLQVSGMFIIDGGGQIDPRWWLVLPTVLGVLFFFLLAMPTVQRARLSTETIGRDGLVGESGLALVDFDPDGLVEVRGARWRGTAHREAGISAGDPVEVTGVDGLFLEVDKKSTGRET